MKSASPVITHQLPAKGKSAVHSQQSIVKSDQPSASPAMLQSRRYMLSRPLKWACLLVSRTACALLRIKIVIVKRGRDISRPYNTSAKCRDAILFSKGALACSGTIGCGPKANRQKPITNRFKLSTQYSVLNTLFLLLTLTACGVVAVQVEEPIPTPTLVATPIPPPPINAESSAGLVAYEAPDDSEVMVKSVALPHIVYSAGGLAIEMFEQWAPPTEYIVVDTGRGFRLRVNWKALWLSDSYGIGRITMDVYLLSPGEQSFQLAQNASTPDVEGWGADQRNELLDSTIFLPGSGDYRIRAEVTVSARDDKQNEESRLYSYESGVVALNSPPKLLSTPEDFTPQFGDLENNGVLLDWRGWRLGPCFLRADDLPDVSALISEACVGFASNDWGAATESLLAALDGTDDNPALHSRIVQQLGTLAAVSGDWQKARECFEEGLKAAREQNDALEVAIALHNLGIAQKMTELHEEGEQNLWQSVQLSDQIEDWLGAALTYGQFGYYWQDTGTLEWVTTTFRDSGIPQAAITQSWLDTLYAQQAEAEGEGG